MLKVMCVSAVIVLSRLPLKAPDSAGTIDLELNVVSTRHGGYTSECLHVHPVSSAAPQQLRMKKAWGRAYSSVTCLGPTVSFLHCIAAVVSKKGLRITVTMAAVAQAVSCQAVKRHKTGGHTGVYILAGSHRQEGAAASAHLDCNGHWNLTEVKSPVVVDGRRAAEAEPLQASTQCVTCGVC